jgi:hypothetical protein
MAYYKTSEIKKLGCPYLHGTFVGSAAHADDIRAIATSTSTIRDQTDRFTSRYYLKLNPAKTENY